MKRKCILILLLFFAVSTMGQSQKGKVYMKNGSVVKGKITESEKTETIRIQSAGNLWVFPLNEIEKIDYTSAKPKEEEHQAISNFSNHTQIGLLFGNSDNSQSAPLFMHSSLDFRVDSKLNVGVGTGVEFLKETHVPVFVNIGYKFRESAFSPFISFKAGYTFPVEDSRTFYYDVVPYYELTNSYMYPYYYGSESLKAKGGLLLNPAFGIVNMFSPNFGMSFSVGYRFTRLHYSGEQDYRLDVDYNRLSVSIGIIFN